MKGRGYQPLWMPLGLSNYKMTVACYVSGAELTREFLFCTRTRSERRGKKNQRITRNLLRNAKLLLWRELLHSRNFSPCMRQAACMEKNKTIPPPPLLPVCLSPPHSIDMHSWPGRCKNRLAVPELEMVTECRLQLLGFWVLSDTSKPGSRWGKLVRDMLEHWGQEPRIMDCLC